MHELQARVGQGQKLRAMYRSLGWSRLDCGKFLHVTERCLRNWEAGRHAIPFAAFKLMRLHCSMELPGAQWRGWSISRGKLCTPEGHELDPRDAAWWSLLIRRAETGSEALRELHEMKRLAGGADAPPGVSLRATGGAAAKPASADPQGTRRAAPLDLYNGHISISGTPFGLKPSSDAIGSVAVLGQWTLTKTGVQHG